VTASRLVGRGLLWGLFASVALNVLLGTWLATSAARWHLAAPPREPGARIEHLAATLPEPDAARLRGAVEADAAAIAAARTAYREADAAMRTTLHAAPYDPAAFAAATSALRERRQELQRLLQGAVGRAAAEMTPEGRAKLADWALH
jgi:hypothetical protein